MAVMPIPAQRGDEAELFRLHHAALLRSVRLGLRLPAPVAEDACSIAWAQLLRTQPRRDQIHAWLRVVAVREAIRLWEQEQRHVALEPESDLASDRALGAGPAAHGPHDGVAGEARAALHAVAALPDRQRHVLTRRLAGYSHAEIAAETGDTLRTVQRQLRRARAGVRAAAGRPRETTTNPPTVAAA